MTEQPREYRDIAGLEEALKRKTEMLAEVNGWLSNARADMKHYDALLNNKNLQIKILLLSLSEKTGVPVEDIRRQVKMKIAEIKPPKPDAPNVLASTETITANDNAEPTDGGATS